MLITLFLILAFGALGCAILSAMGKLPLWVAVLLLAILALAQQLPMGRG